MLKQGIPFGLMLLMGVFSANAADVEVPIVDGKVSQAEFRYAAKRALLGRSYQILSIDDDVVIGKYRRGVEMTIIRGDDALVIRNLKDGGKCSQGEPGYGDTGVWILTRVE